MPGGGETAQDAPAAGGRGRRRRSSAGDETALLIESRSEHTDRAAPLLQRLVACHELGVLGLDGSLEGAPVLAVLVAAHAAEGEVGTHAQGLLVEEG